MRWEIKNIKLSDKGSGLHLSVTDTGSAINEQIAQHLFKDVVSSQDGFGIGLYQCYELAKNHGFYLQVAENIPGQVSFSLSQTSR